MPPPCSVFSCNWPYPSGRPTSKVLLLTFAICTVLPTSLAFLLDGAGLSHDFWTEEVGWRGEYRWEKGGCETKHRRAFLAQRVTSTSNFLFFFCAGLMLALAGKDFADNKIRRHGSFLKAGGSSPMAEPDETESASFPNFIVAFPELSLYLAGVNLLMGASSFMWHASMAVVGADIDYGAMYVLLVFLLAVLFMRVTSFFTFSSLLT
jgi:hypothetical protein